MPIESTPVLRRYGLIGRSLAHSFSPAYFQEKFFREGIVHAVYEAYELDQLEEWPTFLRQHPDLHGLNVTLPYKQDIIPYLDDLSDAARRIGAVNTIQFTSSGLTGYNTDWIGFRDSLYTLLNGDPTSDQRDVPANALQLQALVLGTGGASRAVVEVLRQWAVPYQLVSRSVGEGVLTYAQLTEQHVREHQLIINATPLGTFPDVKARPDIPYSALCESHYLYDLVYNPAITAFLQEGVDAGAKTQNGLAMLVRQAEAAWTIWQTDLSAAAKYLRTNG